jgi:hypothetical protein
MRPTAFLALLPLLALAACNPADRPPPTRLQDRDSLCQRPSPDATHEDEVYCEENIHRAERIRWYTRH